MSIHRPVLLNETIGLLNLKENSVVVDATLGGAGHSREILERIGDGGTLIAFDLDVAAIEEFAQTPNIKFQISNKYQIPNHKIENKILINENFANLSKALEILNIGKVDAILADLGWSSDQLAGKGLSFTTDEELDMRLDRRQTLDAKQVVNEYPREKLEAILKNYGEEKFWKNIAKKIIDHRKDKKIETTKELAQIIEAAVPGRYKYGKLNPATRTFQAIRIEVNQELENLKIFLPQALECLRPGGRLAVISFHSLEDRIVKNYFRENARGCICPPSFPQCVCGKTPNVALVTKKPLTPSDEEVGENPRSRSAKLRVCEKK